MFETILGQQISNQVLEKLILRFEKEDLFKPENMVKKKVSELLDLGLSQRKAHLLLELAKDLLEGRLDLYKAYREHRVYDELLKYHGIGPWTVDMLLIFAFADRDVLSFHDYGIRKAYALLYHQSKVDKKDFTLFQKRMSPYGTIISFYLWALSNDS